MKTRESWKKLLLILVIIIAFACCIVNTLLLFFDDTEPVCISENVDLDMYGQHKSNIDLEKDWKFDDLNVGDRFTVTKRLSQYDLKIPCLYFFIDNVQLEAFLDDELIYEAGKTAAQEHRALGGGLHILPLPSDYAGKVLKLKFVVTDKFKDGISGFIGMKSMENFINDFINNNLPATIAALFSIFCAVVVILIFVYYWRFDKEFRRPLWMTFTIMSVGIYMLAREGLLFLLFPQSIRELCIESFTGLFIIMFGNFYFFDLFDFKGFRKFEIVTSVLTIFSIIYALLVITLHAAGIVHITRFKTFDLILGGSCVLIYTIMTLINIRKIGTVDLLLSASMLIVTLGMFVDNVVVKVRAVNIDLDRNAIVGVGNILFIIITTIAYGLVIDELFDKSLEQKLLTGRAYMDALTGLNNRAYCEHYLEETANEGEYTLINFDLNGLKYVNDHFGHIKGDEYLVAFAKKLKSEFAGQGCTGRMGGDEFIAILKTTDEEKIKENLEKMFKSLQKDEKSFTGNFKKGGISFAYGYCISTKNQPYNPTRAFEIADMRMYSHKQAMKGDNSDEFFRT